ncbi:hypothetical protein FGG08_000871 [Glutinoglossum americanum]|uniref:Zn(2)-C6 fungal-type domain-containing protein n=1 Tax=Glutinoglossum americanum TaxID=1670608 RepID=A0A9P8IC04_9PEZI|nr:hypothetical protein FGG08_000871 [Glutinoglossum americanum]
MSSSSSFQEVGDNFFNDLSKDRADVADGHDIDGASKRGSSVGQDSGDLPRPKRIACVVCRKRKLKCDGNKPRCGKCTRLGHSCAYDEVRKKSGPKRGYVKALEARLAQVETLLKSQDLQDPNGSNLMSQDRSEILLQPEFSSPPGVNIAIGSAMYPQEPYDVGAVTQSPFDPALGSDDPLTWEMIGLGLDEPLPPQEVIDELHQIYFDKCHPSGPMIHRARYLAAMNLAPLARPPVCLRYAIWALAASVEERYFNLQSHFYQRARKYLEETEMKGHGESMISVAYSQTWILIATYEFKLMYFPRAWMSTGRAIRLAQMMGLHRLDGAGLDVKQCLTPPRDWTEREERRRTFWLAFCIDRYASIGTGWPMTVEEKDILTMLPSSEEAYNKSKQPSRTMPLNEALSPSGAANLSPFAGVVLMACLFGRNLIHLHRPDTDDRDDDLNGEFWKRHRTMDNILNNTALSLPSHLKLPAGIADPNIVFSNMNIHTSTICLHQAAIFKAEKNRLPANVSADSQVRCITAALGIANIMRMISHMDLSRMNPFISFSLYVSARVFVQYLRTRPDDDQGKSSLMFLLTAMEALKRKNPLTSSFLVQLDVDIQGIGLKNRPNDGSQFPFGKPAKVPSTDPVQTSCSDFTRLGQPSDPPHHAYPSPSDDVYNPPHYLPEPQHVEQAIKLPNRVKAPVEAGFPERIRGSMSSSPTAAMDTDSDLHTGSEPTSTPNSIGTNILTPPVSNVQTSYGSNGDIYFTQDSDYMPEQYLQLHLNPPPHHHHHQQQQHHHHPGKGSGSFVVPPGYNLDGGGAAPGGIPTYEMLGDAELDECRDRSWEEFPGAGGGQTSFRQTS